jgi:hypothetical protein
LRGSNTSQAATTRTPARCESASSSCVPRAPKPMQPIWMLSFADAARVPLAAATVAAAVARKPRREIRPMLFTSILLEEIAHW